MANDETLVVVRPSGVWNSRAPIHEYTQAVREISATQALAIAAALGFRESVSREGEGSRSARKFFRKRHGPRYVADKRFDNSLRNFFKSLGKRLDGTPLRSCSMNDFIAELEKPVAGATLLSTIQINGAIECFIQCWFLNYALLKIESGKELTKNEIGLILELNPARKRIPAATSRIIRQHGFLNQKLKSIPPYFRDPVQRKEVFVPVKPDENALEELRFWLSYRNQLVHANGIAGPKFFNRWHYYYENKRQYFPFLPVLELSKPLPVHDSMFGAQAACFYKIATVLTEVLEIESDFRRGHLDAPNSKQPGELVGVSPPLLMEGDHATSLQWTRDAEFRSKLATERGWKFLAT